MVDNIAYAVDAVLGSLHSMFEGPGGVAGIVKDGEVIAKRAWGYADPLNRTAMTAQTLLPICSITKQFTCALLLDLIGDPSKLDARLADHLPALEGELPKIAHLCNNQSGLRDYWALSVLQGANAEDAFGREDAKSLFARMKSTHFRPGSQYSYANTNFRILSDLIEDHCARSFGELLRDGIFASAGMETAVLAENTSDPLNGAAGHEGNPAAGFSRVLNRIHWSGDGAIAASLDDMLNWEIFIDRTRHDPEGLYNRLSKSQFFDDCNPSQYALGLGSRFLGGVALTGHGGALRGFRCRRLHAASHRLSVVVMFNHEADALDAALAIMQAALRPGDTPTPHTSPATGWSGHYLEPASGLVLGIDATSAGLATHFSVVPETLAMTSPDTASSSTMTLVRKGKSIEILRAGENFSGLAAVIPNDPVQSVEGRFYSDEVDAWLTLASAGGAFHGCFDGPLGRSTMYPLKPLGKDVWSLSCPRSMDAPAPGDWTVQVRRDSAGRIDGLVLGCWLARNILYRKIG